jgi:ABC-type Fe3+-siderophore transport system permease subunit
MLLPCSAVMGALLLVGSDIIARLLNMTLPVGAITALLGAPIFLYFLIKIRTAGWGR